MLTPFVAAIVLSAKQESSIEAYMQDLDLLQKRLPEVHLNFSKLVAPADWEARCQKVRTALPQVPDAVKQLKMAELVASVGVAHTWLEFSGKAFNHMPIRLLALEDGVWVYATTDRFKELAGARVLKIGSVSADRAAVRLGGIDPAENDHWRRVNALNWSGVAEAYQAVGLAESPGGVTMTFQLPSGKKLQMDVPSEPNASNLVVSWDSNRLPAYMRRQSEIARIVDHRASKSLVLDYRRCQFDPNMPMKDLATKFWQQFDQGGFENVVVDLRRNGGGNSAVLLPFILSLKARPQVVLEKRVFALISSQTFSSGMMNAVELKRAGAVLIGEPTGGSPNSYGEQKSFELPKTGMKVTYCTKYFKLVPDADMDDVRPDFYAPIRWKDLILGRDLALETVYGEFKRRAAGSAGSPHGGWK